MSASESRLEGARVIAAMSGGVDSSVTAKLLKDAGADVLGVTMQLYQAEDLLLPDGSEPSRVCCSLDDVEDARSVCRRLDLPHQVLNCAHDFAAKVMDPFCASYLRGETPNPCIECNRYLKFTALQVFRAQAHYEYVATGHYVRRRFNEETGRFELLRARDVEKDQSYVLYSLSQEQLAHTLFPLGEMTKPEVRAVAAQSGFDNADKGESQDICFIPDGDYLSFIRRRTGHELEPGDIVDRKGTLLGKHNGLAAYTIGQRKGIRVAAAYPLYVCGKDLERNCLVVGPREDTLVTRVVVRSLNMVALSLLEKPTPCEAKLTYRQKPQPAIATQTGSDELELVFENPVRATAPGQAAVLYDGDVVLAGGTIASCR